MASSIRDVYTTVKNIDGYGIEGYQVDKKYYDPMKMKEQRALESSKDRIQGKKNPNQSKKTSFIDVVEKRQAKLPGPCSYDPKQPLTKSRVEALTVPTRRKTVFDDIQSFSKKQNFPGAGTYGKIETQADKAKLKSNIGKAENSNYLDSSMRYSLQSPGVGQYNSHHALEAAIAGPKWVADKEKKQRASKSLKLPPVGTYNPLPLEYSLFQNSINGAKKKKTVFNKQERFKKSRDKPLPFYNVLSEWGLKDKNVKRDILARISSPSSGRSVYH